jgi:flagellar basal body-associated protein FliL
MATPPPKSRAAAHISDWMLELSIGIIVLLMGLGAWLYTNQGNTPAEQARPRPIWLGVPKVMAQMGDGRMVNVKVNLRLNHQDDIDELEPHLPAFKALIQDTGATTSRDDMQARQGILRFSGEIRESLNDYLEEHGTGGRVKDVVFEEMTLLP